MNAPDERPVRFTCTDGGQHRRGVVATLRLTSTSVEYVRSVRSTSPFNRSGQDTLRRRWRDDDGLGATADFDLHCTRCQRNPRATGERLRQIVAALLTAYPDTPSVVVDISTSAMARLV